MRNASWSMNFFASTAGISVDNYDNSPLDNICCRFIAFEITRETFVQRFSSRNALMEILKDITGKGNGVVIDKLQALIGAGSVLFGMYVHHMSFQFFVVHR